MKFKNLIKSAALVALLSSGSAFAAPVELVVNGSFEANHQAAGTWANYNNLTGWTGGEHGIELRNNVAGVAADGVNFVELDTNKNSSMTQSVQTVLGQHYTLTFQFENRPGVAISSQGLSVDWGGAEIAHVNNSLNGTWETRTYSLIGDGSAMKLKFIATGTSDSYGTSLDNVSLTTAVPEPETYAMLLAGLGLVGVAARRRKAAK
ncbi:PEPxxWA-CTERM sorting domain-containing protein [Rugamonas sp. FT82W]|uniref:PEPxxWA-CTERM sorting domain-containing protein n=1 Tax=Duganella vulcania TaxID=2692166 RepID=A0A845G0V3_9BURK|nr:FxDxF family PEP-CTERM protein [Duganella vulcania]MYM87481.1 PEPxxWA-CTERM sorting domain-containing protein [Duganella vulcania]